MLPLAGGFFGRAASSASYSRFSLRAAALGVSHSINSGSALPCMTGASFQ